jgi:hypothetical protein
MRPLSAIEGGLDVKRLSKLVGLILMAAAPALGQEVGPEDELRAEIARLKVHLARAEALLDRLEAANPPAPRDSTAEAQPPQSPGAAQPDIQPPRRSPALNTPPKLPPSSEAGFRKEPPRVDVLVQTRFDHFADTNRNSTFFLRKAEVGVKGHVARHIDFSLELDPARAPVNDPFRRTYIRLSHLSRLHVKVGLEKAPIGLEELTANGQIPFVDRSEVTDRFAAAEEMGLFLESTWDRWMFQASVTNGGRRLLRDDNRQKDFTARAVWAVREKLSFGVSTLQGRAGADAQDRIRYNVEAKYGTDNLRGAQAEYYRAKDGEIWGDAFYVAAFWAKPVSSDWLTHVQPVARYESIDRSHHNPVDELRLVTVGVSLLFQELRAKLQMNWLSDVRRNSPRKNELRTQYTVEF